MSFFDDSMAPMLEMFVFEANTLIDQLDKIMLNAENKKTFSKEDINEIFRIMHTIKGSSAMMNITSMSNLAHKIEDIFFIIRDNNKSMPSDISKLFDIIFSASDFFKNEISIIYNDDYSPSTVDHLMADIEDMINLLNNPDQNENREKKTTSINKTLTNKTLKEEDKSISFKVFFEKGIGMENIRAFMLLNAVKEIAHEITSTPQNPEQDSTLSTNIEANGFILTLYNMDLVNEVENAISSFINVRSYEKIKFSEDIDKQIEQFEQKEEIKENKIENNLITDERPISKIVSTTQQDPQSTLTKSQSILPSNLISVNQTKLDKLMDIVGEIVIAESMVTSNPDLKGLNLDNFYKASRHLGKLTNELQDIVMSIRMVPISGIFNKMNRIIRDVSKKINKDVILETIGEDTEIDKTVSDIMSDPFMHMVRNAVDHAIELPDDREKNGKSRTGTITLEAHNIGSEIIIRISDDGKGLDAKQIYRKAVEKGLNIKQEHEYTEKEIFSFIMQPGFSTKDVVTEFSGRGVGMDVVKQNIEKIGGLLTVDSEYNKGTTFTIKIPLTLAIIDGMTFSVGKSIFTIPITSVRESFQLSDNKKLLSDSSGNEMIMLRGECYPILRLNKFYCIDDAKENFKDGIFILIEVEKQSVCLFVDHLIGEQQVVVKPLPAYLNKYNIKNKGLSGCTILGDGSISLILDTNSLVHLD